MKIKVFALDELADAADRFLTELADNRIVAFYGEMGAGKTTFIKAVLEKMNIEDTTSSPTFSIVNEYFSVNYGTVYHFDFYRIEDEFEALDIGVEEMFDSGNYCFIEWPERIQNLLPENHVRVTITDEIDYRLIDVENED